MDLINFFEKTIKVGDKWETFEFRIAPALQTLPTLPFGQIKDLQGNFKDLKNKNAHKLCLSIHKYGFFMPVFVWEDTSENIIYTVDGHQRKRILEKFFGKKMLVPVVYIDAADKIQAKEKLLAINSKYGEITKDGFDEFTFDLDMGIVSDIFTFEEFKDIEINGEEQVLEKKELLVCPNCDFEIQTI
jgi:hypothetical protein